MTQGRQAADPIAPTPPAYSLLVAADTPPPPSGLRWQMGVEWRPELMYGNASLGVVECEGDLTVSPGASRSIGTADPFDVWTVDTCSTIGFEANDYEGRARRALAAKQSWLIAHELQLGGLRDASGLGNVALKDATPITPSPASVVNAFAELEGAIGVLLFGQRAMLHVTPQVLAIAKANQLIQQAGQKWVTAMGSVVVSDAGYLSENDGNVWAYATPMIEVWLGDPFVVPGSFPAAMREAMDRQHNTISVWAHRLALVHFDGTLTDDAGGGTAQACVKVQVNVDPYVI